MQEEFFLYIFFCLLEKLHACNRPMCILREQYFFFIIIIIIFFRFNVIWEDWCVYLRVCLCCLACSKCFADMKVSTGETEAVRFG